MEPTDGKERIKQSDLWKAMQIKEFGRYKRFSFSYVRLNDSREGNGAAGSIQDYKAAVFSSIYQKGETVNIRIVGEVRPRKFLKCMIIKFNGKKVYA